MAYKNTETVQISYEFGSRERDAHIDLENSQTKAVTMAIRHTLSFEWCDFASL